MVPAPKESHVEVEEHPTGVAFYMTNAGSRVEGDVVNEVLIRFDNRWSIRLWEGGLRVEEDMNGIQYEAEWQTDWESMEFEEEE